MNKLANPIWKEVSNKRWHILYFFYDLKQPTPQVTLEIVRMFICQTQTRTQNFLAEGISTDDQMPVLQKTSSIVNSKLIGRLRCRRAKRLNRVNRSHIFGRLYQGWTGALSQRIGDWLFLLCPRQNFLKTQRKFAVVMRAHTRWDHTKSAHHRKLWSPFGADLSIFIFWACLQSVPSMTALFQIYRLAPRLGRTEGNILTTYVQQNKSDMLRIVSPWRRSTRHWQSYVCLWKFQWLIVAR